MKKKYHTKVIVFEGMPGAGKTKTVMALKKILKKKAFVVPQTILLSSNDSLEISKKYLDIEAEKADNIRKLAVKYTHIFVDRTFLTTLAYAYACSKMDNDPHFYGKLLEYFYVLDEGKRLLRPTQLILFFVEMSKSLKRRSKYAKVGAFKRWFEPLFLKHLENFYRDTDFTRFNMPRPVVIDTTHMKPDAVSSVIAKYLLLQ